MLVTDNFVFVHIPKTGGTWVESVVKQHMTSVRYLSRHSSYSRLPAELQHLPVLCVVRNPWDWYVSWYHHHMRIEGRKAKTREKLVIWEDVLRSGQADFKEAVTRACAGDFEHGLASIVREEGIDFYSAYVKALVGDALDKPNFTALRFERMRKQLLRFLVGVTDVRGDLRAAILEEPPQRTSSHGHYSDYYDPELRRVVGQRTTWLRERFDYRFRRPRADPLPSEGVSDSATT